MKIRSLFLVVCAAFATIAVQADAVLLFSENFSNNSVGWNTSSGTPVFDNAGWTYTSTCKSKSAIKMGTISATGSATTPTINLETGWKQANITVTFQAAAWYGYSSGLTLSKIEDGDETELESWSVSSIASSQSNAESIDDLSSFTKDANEKAYSATFTNLRITDTAFSIFKFQNMIGTCHNALFTSSALTSVNVNV